MRVLMLFLLLSPTPVMSDHLPQDLLAKGEAEKTLCGIDVNKSHASDLAGAVRQAHHLRKVPRYQGCRRDHLESRGSRIHVYVNIDNVTYGVEISGSPASDATTGRGLSLGSNPSRFEACLRRPIRAQRFQDHHSVAGCTELRAYAAQRSDLPIMLVAPVDNRIFGTLFPDMTIFATGKPKR